MLPKVKLPKTGLEVSSLCFGTADWGSKKGQDDIGALYAAFREAGGNCFDSAHCYAFWLDALGASERELGAAVRKYDKREDVIICTKGCHPHGGDKYSRPEKYMSPALLERDLRDSLERLQMDYVDIYFLHRDDPAIPVDEIMDALHSQQQAGRIRYSAASNWQPDRLEAAEAYARRKGYTGFVASQVLYNLAHWSRPIPKDLCIVGPEHESWHKKTQMPLFAYSSTANGYFATGKSTWSNFDDQISADRRERVRNAASEMGKSPNQIALAYLLNQPFPVVPIIGTMKLDHLQDAIGAAEVRLSPAQIAALVV